MDSRSKSPPLFSDNEDETPSPSKRLRSDQIQDGDSDSDDPMAGFMDGYEDLSPDEIEVKDTEYALVLGFIEGSVALDEVPAHCRFEARRRKSAWDAKPKPTPTPMTQPLTQKQPLTQQPQRPSRFERQLTQLSEMGFADNENLCIRALESTDGNIDAAVDWLCENPAPDPNPAPSSSSVLRTVPTLQKTLSDEELNMQYIRQLQKEEQEQERLRKQRVLEDEAIARKIQQQVEKEEHDKLLAQMKASKSSSLPALPSNSQGSSSSAYSSQAIKRDPPSFVKPEPFNGVDLTNDDDSDPYQPFYDRKAASSFSASSSSSQQPSKFVPPPPVIKYGSQYNSFTESAKPYNPNIPPTPTKPEPIYDMATLLPGGSNYNPNIKPEYDPNEGPWEAPLKEGEVVEQLKDLLENVALTENVPPIEDRIQSPDELKVQLLEHQKIGVDWMVRMEKGTNKGGILADDMGLGKTMQTIATMILNRSEDRERRTTLIVAPTSLILQWQEEIKSRVRAGVFKVFLYYGKERKNMTSNRLKQYDIVITTYGTVAMEWPQTKKKRAKKDPFEQEDEDQAYERELQLEKEEEQMILAQRGELFKVKWHRVVLDEAHIVKNKNTRSARACVQLNSSLRWCLTGTPIQNKIGELYSLIDFLDIKPYCKWEKFRDEIEKPFKAGKHKRVMKRVQALLKAICLRRTKASQLDGKPIITLKPKTSSLIEVDFTGPEREFYDSMQKKVLLKFNAYLKAGTVMQNYSNVLVLLLRLRQACCHPKLVSEKFNEAPPELLEAAAPGAHPQAVVDPLEALTPEIQTRLLGMKLKSGYECPICFDAITLGKIIVGCGHVFCGECITEYAGMGENGVEKVCPECRGPIGVHTLVSVDAFLKSAKKAGMKESVVEVNGNGKRVKEETEEDLSAKAKGKRRKLISDEESDEDDDEDEPELDVEDGWISSTKIDQMMKVILKIRRESPHDKIIVFTQFRGMMDLCETPLRGSKIGFVRYDGSMTADQRDQAVSTLKHDSETHVILVSLKCGSLGLNLTCANHVIILDFWWNVAVENQAVDRVHRFGQEKEVSVHRISIKNTVEQRILQLQAEKQDMFNNALGEGGVKGLSKNRLGLNDLIQLFRGSGGGADLSDEE